MGEFQIVAGNKRSSLRCAPSEGGGTLRSDSYRKRSPPARNAHLNGTAGAGNPGNLST